MTVVRVVVKICVEVEVVEMSDLVTVGIEPEVAPMKEELCRPWEPLGP